MRAMHNVLGGTIDPHASYLLLRGMKTLDLRVQRQNATATDIAARLEAHPLVTRVHYPGLASHPDHAIAAAQMSGYGGVVSFEVDGDLWRTARFVDSVQLPYIAPSLGGVESLIEQPTVIRWAGRARGGRRGWGARGARREHAVVCVCVCGVSRQAGCMLRPRLSTRPSAQLAARLAAAMRPTCRRPLPLPPAATGTRAPRSVPRWASRTTSSASPAASSRRTTSGQTLSRRLPRYEPAAGLERRHAR